MLDYGEYSTVPNYQQGGDGSKPLSYDQLDGEWLTYYKVASKYVHKARYQDRDDLLHTIMVNLTDMAKSNTHKPNNLSWMYRIASFTVAQYWRDYYKRTNGIDCGHCSNRQRKKCKADDLYTECPRAITIESLNKPIVGDDGHISELAELIADDRAIDLEAWLDEATWRLGYPQRLVEIARKVTYGIPLDAKDKMYLQRFRQREQKKLF
jgi:DNA-directed RNA polymerase specialized sigma24 family protein